MSARRVPVAPLPPQPPAISLLTSSLRPQAEVDLSGRPLGNRWEDGFIWAPEVAPAIGGRNECGDATAVTYREGEAVTQREHQPVILTAEYECSALGVDWEYYRGRAIAALIAGEPLAAEAELWDGTLARAAIANSDTAYEGNLWLTKHGVAEDVTPTPGTAVSVKRGLEVLEQFLADNGTGGPGTIHMRPECVPNVGIRNNGPQLLTWRNTLVIPGVGYSGNGPATTDGGDPVVPDDGTVWMFATGLITYRQGEIVVTPDLIAQAVDRRVNDVTVTAQRAAAATWDAQLGTLVGAVLVTLPA